MGKIIHIHSRPRAVVDWECSRKYYYSYEYGGRGIRSNASFLALFLGTALHDALAGIAFQTQLKQPVDIDAIAKATHDEILETLSKDKDLQKDLIFAEEQATLIEGSVRAFYKHAWPALLKDYPVVLAVEQEMTFGHDGMLFVCKPDLVLGKADGSSCVYVEYKSTSSKKEQWFESWRTAIQLHATTRAIEQTLGIPTDGFIVQGIYKGYESYGKQHSPICYAYRKAGNPPFTKEEFSYEYKAGFKKYPVWELDGGSQLWIDNMPTEVLADQLPRTELIFVKEDMMDAFFAQRAIRHKEIRLATAIIDEAGKDDDEDVVREVLNTSFAQNFDKCTPAWGFSCPFKPLCFGEIGDPLKSGYMWRELHTEIEKQLIGETKDEPEQK